MKRSFEKKLMVPLTVLGMPMTFNVVLQEPKMQRVTYAYGNRTVKIKGKS